MAALLAGMASSSMASTGSNVMNKMKTMVGLKEEQPKTILNTIDEAVTLTWKQVRAVIEQCVLLELCTVVHPLHSTELIVVVLHRESLASGHASASA